MNYRLGLDLGTNSIGWCIYSLNTENKPEKLENIGVRIFSDGRDPKTKEPLAVGRRTARGQRKLIYRRKLRRKLTFRLLQKQGLVPNTKEEALKLKLLNPYELRIKALDKKLEPFELGRILFNLSVRRGFKSNRKDNTEVNEENSKSEKLTQADKCSNLLKIIKESNCRTIGEYLWKNQEQNGGIRFVPGRMDYYPLRQLYVDEFTKIREKQEHYFANVDWDSIYHALFDQRPLKPQERGKCQYMTDKERTYKAMPCSQEMRILQDIYNLNFINKGKTIDLLPEWREELIKLFNSKEKVTFDEMLKKLGLDSTCTFNLESEARKFLLGNSANVKLSKDKCFGSEWNNFSLEEKDEIVETLITAEEDEAVEKMLSKYTFLTEEQKTNITKLNFQTGTTSLCKEITEKIVREIEEKKCQLHEAIINLGFNYASQEVVKSDILPYYGKVLIGSTMSIKANPKNDEEKYGKISNPTVHIALNQTRTVVNALIKEYGKPTQIVIELSRDLKASREAKTAIRKKITENQKRNAIENNSIKEIANIPYPNRTDRLKYRLWEELGTGKTSRQCIYCGKNIGGTDLFSDNTEIEHILPYGRTLCDSESNKTVSCKKCNDIKGNRSPFEAFGNSPAGYNWQDILHRASLLKNPKKRMCFAENAMEKFEKESSFITRQLTDNAYLAKMALRYLHAVCDNVWSVNGGMTKLLRDKWEIDSILKRKITDNEIAHFKLKSEQIGTYKKNRYDHRHHALDASVIALIDRSMVKQISDLNKKHLKNQLEAPNMANFVLREDLTEKVKNIVVSFKPDHGAQGQLSKETLLGKIKREEQISITEIKSESDIALIKNQKVKADFVKQLETDKDIKKVVKVLKDMYPTVKVFRPWFVARTSLLSLKEKDIETIVDKEIQKKINDFIAVNKNLKFEDCMEAFSKQYGVKKVRCINRVQTPIKITSGKTPRYLCPDDYFAAIVWQLPPKKEGAKETYQATFIRRDQVLPTGEIKNKKEKKPHPAAKEICLLHKDDYLEFTDNGKMYKCKIAGYSATNGGIDFRPIFAVTDCKDWIIATNDNLLEPCWKSQKGQNFISVNVLFGEKKAHPITVNPIGRVFRKK